MMEATAIDREFIPNPVRTRWLLFGLAMLAVAIYLVWEIYADHAPIDRAERQRLAIHASVVEQNLGRQFLAVDQALKSVRNGLGHLKARSISTEEASARFQSITEAIPGVRSILLVDANGVCVASNRKELIGVDFRQGERFQSMSRDANAEKLYISAPFKTPLGVLAMGLGKVLLDASGAFAGYVLAIVEPDFFRTLLTSVLYAPDMRATVIHGDGKIIMRVPGDDGIGGGDVARPGSLFMAHMKSGRTESVQAGAALSDGAPRISVLRTMQIPAVPMHNSIVIATSRNNHAIFAHWRQQSLTKLALFVLLVLVGSGGLLFYQRRYKAFAAIADKKDAQRRLAEQNLRRSEEHLSVTLHSIGDAVIATDAAGRITEMNRTAEKLTGWSLEEAKGQPLSGVFRIIDSQSRAVASDPVQRVLEKGEIIGLNSHTALIARDGAEHQIADSAAPIRRADGTISGVVLVFSDVTEKYRAQQALGEREALLRTFSDNAQIGIIMVTADHRYAFVNAAYAKSQRRTIESLLGQHVSEVLGELYESRMRAKLERAFAGERITDEFALPYPTKDSPLRHLAVTCERAVQTSRGLCVIVLVTDITERKLAEAEQGQLAAIFEGTHDAIVLRAPGDIVIGWNAAAERLFGWRKSEAIGKKFRELVSTTPSDAMLYRFERVLQGETLPLLEDTRVHKNGSLITVETTMSGVRDKAGAIVAVACIMRDITARKQAEQFRNLLAAAIDSSNNAIFIRKPDRTVVYCNKMATQLFGYLPEDVLGTDLSLMVPPDLANERDESWARLEQGGRVQNFETVRLRKDGTRLDVAISAAIVRDASGNAIGVASVIRDISDRKRARLELEDSRNQLRAALEAMSDAVIISDSQGHFVEFNEAFSRIHRFAAKSDCPVQSEAYPALLDVQSMDGAVLPLVDWPITKALRGEAGVGAEFTVRHKATGKTWIASYNYAPIHDAQGHISGAVVTGRDITEHKESELARARLAAIVENSNDAIFGRTLDGIILTWNKGAEAMFGYTADEALGRNVDILLPPEQQSRVRQNNALVLSGERFVVDSVRMTKNKKFLYVRTSLSPLRDQRGNINGVSVTLQDQTALKQAEEGRRLLEGQLIEAQKMQAIGTLAGGVAHDFNNIIATIIGNAELARDDATGNEGVLESVAEILRASSRAKDLVQQILSFSRRQPTELKLISLEPVVREAARLLRATLPKRVSLDVLCAQDVPQVLADATQIQQVLINLCTNALHAMPKGAGIVRVRLDTIKLDEAMANTHASLQSLYATHPGTAVRISVADTGMGMDTATMKRIFEPFFTTKPVNEGTGLGLSVVHGIVQGHGGAVVVESEPGKGATFSVYLPCGRVDASQHDGNRNDAGAVAVEDRSRGLRVLYIDDDRMLVSLVARTLERRGYRISAHVSAMEGLEKLRADPDAFDLVLTDYNMPEMSGLDVARAVREIRETLPVLVTSGFIDDALLAQARDAGVREVISKVDSVEQLCATLQQVTTRL